MTENEMDNACQRDLKSIGFRAGEETDREKPHTRSQVSQLTENL